MRVANRLSALEHLECKPLHTRTELNLETFTYAYYGVDGEIFNGAGLKYDRSDETGSIAFLREIKHVLEHSRVCSSREKSPGIDVYLADRCVNLRPMYGLRTLGGGYVIYGGIWGVVASQGA